MAVTVVTVVATIVVAAAAEYDMTAGIVSGELDKTPAMAMIQVPGANLPRPKRDIGTIRSVAGMSTATDTAVVVVAVVVEKTEN
jgi:hypothetical protein